MKSDDKIKYQKNKFSKKKKKDYKQLHVIAYKYDSVYQYNKWNVRLIASVN